MPAYGRGGSKKSSSGKIYFGQRKRRRSRALGIENKVPNHGNHIGQHDEVNTDVSFVEQIMTMEEGENESRLSFINVDYFNLGRNENKDFLEEKDPLADGFDFKQEIKYEDAYSESQIDSNTCRTARPVTCKNLFPISDTVSKLIKEECYNDIPLNNELSSRLLIANSYVSNDFSTVEERSSLLHPYQDSSSVSLHDESISQETPIKIVQVTSLNPSCIGGENAVCVDRPSNKSENMNSNDMCISLTENFPFAKHNDVHVISNSKTSQVNRVNKSRNLLSLAISNVRSESSLKLSKQRLASQTNQSSRNSLQLPCIVNNLPNILRKKVLAKVQSKLMEDASVSKSNDSLVQEERNKSFNDSMEEKVTSNSFIEVSASTRSLRQYEKRSQNVKNKVVRKDDIVDPLLQCDVKQDNVKNLQEDKSDVQYLSMSEESCEMKTQSNLNANKNTKKQESKSDVELLSVIQESPEMNTQSNLNTDTNISDEMDTVPLYMTVTEETDEQIESSDDMTSNIPQLEVVDNPVLTQMPSVVCPQNVKIVENVLLLPASCENLLVLNVVQQSDTNINKQKSNASQEPEISVIGEQQASKTDRYPYKCSVCQQSFVYKCNYIEHQRKHLNGNSNSPKKQKTKKINLPPGKLPYECKICHKVCTDLAKLGTHTLSHISHYPCSDCGKIFPKLSALKLHSCKHSKFSCKDCGKTFHYASFLETHEKTHCKTQYSCSVCDKIFLDVPSLELHKRKHQRHVCSVCGKSFRFLHFLETHRLVHANNSEGPVIDCISDND